jgi:uncharacterized protein YndB with AHSA1/START domain
MSVTDVCTDPTALTLTVTSEWAAPIDQVWQLWADPRKLERWWGPPTSPATVVEHDLRPGGSVCYYMTGPEGDRSYFWWKIVEVDAPHSLKAEDGGWAQADADGNPMEPEPDEGPSGMSVTLAALSSEATSMGIQMYFSTSEALQQAIDMDMDEGMKVAVAQIEEILSVPAA